MHIRLIIATLIVALLPTAHAEPPGIDDSMIDPTVAPCDDFYRHACGGWLAAHPVPPDEVSWGIDDVVTERILGELRAILEKAAAAPTAQTRKIGDFYAACMDEARIATLGVGPVQPSLDRIAALGSRDALPALIADLHLAGVAAFFDVSVGQDAHDATRNIILLDEGGLGLPGRDYYLKEDADSAAIRRAYRDHVATVLALAGDDPQSAGAAAASVLAVETLLARGAYDRLRQRDPQQTYHRLDAAALGEFVPGFAWRDYFAALGTTAPAAVDVTEPSFMTAMGAALGTADLAALKAYLRWHLLNSATATLPQPFIDANFAFFGTRLGGAVRLRPRWKRCIAAVNLALGEDLGRAWVAQAFPPPAKARTLTMIDDIAHAFADDIRGLGWMGPATRRQALAKLRAMRRKVGYPDHWRDYGALVVRPDDAFGNAERAAAFELKRQLAKLGRPVDRGEWDMTPPTVDAYYDPQLNDINFPAGVLQPPLFSPAFDAAANYGATGTTMGHEMTHGFDDEGRQFDGNGNLTDWWTPADAKGFDEHITCLRDQFAGYTIVDDIHINSKLTSGEDTADLGGTLLAYLAWKKQTAGMHLQPQDGFTPDQRFFIGYAQWACENERPENLRVSAITDPHSPGKYRVNGIVSDLPQFAQAFGCKAGQPMVSAMACKIW